MRFNRHSYIEGQHAFLGASKYSWTNYDESKLSSSYLRHLATQRGTELHDFASKAIKLGVNLPKNHKTINMYVNDAIGFKMTPEQPLFFSINCFGTADAISFRKNVLRIHDLKTGSCPTSMRQLEIYAAIFCLEYVVKPADIQIELRTYQKDEILVHIPTSEVISGIMQKIISFDRVLEKMKQEG